MTDETSALSVAVLISGGGSNLQAMIDAAERPGSGFNIDLVISNKPAAFGLKRAADAGIATECVRHVDFPDRRNFETELASCLKSINPGLIVLAGFMRILTAEFVDQFAGRILNIHPSLLPKYPGLHTHERAIEAGDQVHGCTVHFVTAELDGGPPVYQAMVPVAASDTPDLLAARVLRAEHRVLPRTVALFAAGRIQFSKNKALLDGTPMVKPLLLSDG